MGRAPRALFGPGRSEPQLRPVEPARDQRLVWSALVLATLVAAALRLPFLGHQSLWFDEIYTRDIVGEGGLAGVWNHVRATESTPPLYYVVAWLFGGRSAASMRLISALALIAAVPVSYFALRRLIGARAALATAAILAVSPELVQYSTDARAYALLVLMALLSLWGFSAARERDSWRRYLAWAAACVACVWTHYFGAFLVVAEVAALLAIRPLSRRATLAWTAAIVVCLLPLLPLVLRQNGDERAAFIAGISLRTRLEQAVRQFAMGANVPRTWLEAAGLALACGGIAVGAVMAARSGRGPRVVLMLAVITLGAPLLLSVTGIEDRFYARNVVVVLPLAAALAAPALLRFRAVPLAAYLALATLTSVWVATNWRYEQVDWRTALARAEASDRGAAVVAVTALGGRVVRTYLGEHPATSAVSARRAWILVEPVRAAGHRALGPAPVPAAVSAGLASFEPVHQAIVEGFRELLVGAPTPRPIVPSDLPGAQVFAPPTAR